MSKALNETGRDIVYSLCNWGDDNPFDWAYTMSNSGRMSGDIYSSYNRPDAACPCTEVNLPSSLDMVYSANTERTPVTGQDFTALFSTF
jgi:hypothetical protein